MEQSFKIPMQASNILNLTASRFLIRIPYQGEAHLYPLRCSTTLLKISNTSNLTPFTAGAAQQETVGFSSKESSYATLLGLSGTSFAQNNWIQVTQLGLVA
eukprot:958398-Pelagomonas_calceolata.AAC.3